MKRILTIVFAFAAGFSLSAQRDSSGKIMAAISGPIVDFSVDNLDNVYVLTATDQIKKYNATGDSVAVFNNIKNYGKVFTIEASNPLKILVYYKDFSTIVVLDRLLSVRNTIDLRRLNLFNVKAIAQSYDNNVWLYDENESKLKKVSDEGKVLFETTDFRQLFGESPSIKSIFDQDGLVYLYDPASGVFVFDYYGTLRNRIPLTRWENFKVAGKLIFGTNTDTLHRYNISTLILDEEKLPVLLKTALKLNFTSQRLYALKKDFLEIYRFH